MAASKQLIYSISPHVYPVFTSTLNGTIRSKADGINSRTMPRIASISSYGISNLYKGLTPFMGQMFIKYGLRFSTYEYLRGNSDNIYKSIFSIYFR